MRRRRPRFKRWESPCWLDLLSVHSREMYTTAFRPLVGFNPWIERVTNGGWL